MDFVNEISSKIQRKTARDITTKLKQILCFAEDEYDLRIRIRKIKLPKVESIVNVNKKRIGKSKFTNFFHKLFAFIVLIC